MNVSVVVPAPASAHLWMSLRVTAVVRAQETDNKVRTSVCVGHAPLRALLPSPVGPKGSDAEVGADDSGDLAVSRRWRKLFRKL